MHQQSWRCRFWETISSVIMWEVGEQRFLNIWESEVIMCVSVSLFWRKFWKFSIFDKYFCEDTIIGRVTTWGSAIVVMVRLGLEKLVINIISSKVWVNLVPRLQRKMMKIKRRGRQLMMMTIFVLMLSLLRMFVRFILSDWSRLSDSEYISLMIF